MVSRRCEIKKTDFRLARRIWRNEKLRDWEKRLQTISTEQTLGQILQGPFCLPSAFLPCPKSSIKIYFTVSQDSLLFLYYRKQVQLPIIECGARDAPFIRSVGIASDKLYYRNRFANPVIKSYIT